MTKPEHCDKVTDISEEFLLGLEHETRLRLNGECATTTGWFEQNLQLLFDDRCRGEPKLHVEVLLLFFQWYYKEGQFELARELGTKAAHVSRAARLPALLRRSLNLLGTAHTQIGNLSDASLCLVEALEVADHIGDRVGKTAVVANLSAARFNAGLLAETIALNRYVIQLAAGEPHMRQLAAYAHHNIALSCLLLNDISTATNEIESAIDLIIDIKNQFCVHQRLLSEVTYSRILVQLGRLKDARTRAGIANEYARELNTSPSKVQADLANILCEAAEGSATTALAHLSEVRKLIKEDGFAYRDFLEVERQCHEFAGQGDSSEHSHERHLRSLAHFQRHAAIQQVAALQRSITSWGATSEFDLLALPKDARERLIDSWTRTNKQEILRQQIEAIADVADQREDWSGEHSMRVGRLVRLIAEQVGLADNETANIGFAARLHDIGKLAIPDVLLLKRGKLGPKEFDILRRHTVEGCQILTDILCTMERHKAFANTEQIGVLRLAAEVAHAHHEWWDGSGYPRGLRGVAIPEAARITALADVFDELTNARPYKEPCSVDDAMSQITGLSGKQFEPRLCDAFARLIKRLQAEHGPELKGFAPREEELSPYQIANRVIERIVEQAGGRSEMRGARHHAPELTVV